MQLLEFKVFDVSFIQKGLKFSFLGTAFISLKRIQKWKTLVQKVVIENSCPSGPNVLRD
jgi:hypothetical protein